MGSLPSDAALMLAYTETISQLELVDGEPCFERVELGELEESSARALVLRAPKASLLRIRPVSCREQRLCAAANASPCPPARDCSGSS